MERDKLYEEIKKYKKDNIRDDEIILKLMNEGVDVSQAMKKVKDYTQRKLSAEKLYKLTKNVIPTRNRDEYGINVIENEDEWYYED